MTEDERAEQYRADCIARLEAARARLDLLRGSDTAAQEVFDNWQPVICWLHERREFNHNAG